MAEQDVQIEEKILTTLQAILAYLQNTKTPPPPPPPPELQMIAQTLQAVQQTLQAMQTTQQAVITQLMAQNATLNVISNRLYAVDIDLEPTPIAGTVVVSQITT